MHTPEETALLVKLLGQKAGHKRARISVKTLRRLSGRKHLRGKFVQMLDRELDSIGVILIELDRGGFGLISSSSLDGAPPITAKRYLGDVLRDLRRGTLGFDEIRKSLDLDGIGELDDD